MTELSSMFSSMDRLLNTLRLELANLQPNAGQHLTALLANVEAARAKELQDLTFEVSLYKKEALRLKDENQELRLQLINRQVGRMAAEAATHEKASATTTQQDSKGDKPSPAKSVTPNKTIAASEQSGRSSKTVSPTPSTESAYSSPGEPPKPKSAPSPAQYPRLPASEGSHYDVSRSSVPLMPPFPNHYQGNHALALTLPLPHFKAVMNYSPLPGNSSLVEKGQQRCTMCGHSRLFAQKPADGVSPFIPKQNKGVCTACDVKVWIMPSKHGNGRSGLHVKWCKGCKNFQHWASFGEKGWATKCAPCRKRMADKYAAKKESSTKKRPRVIHHDDDPPAMSWY